MKKTVTAILALVFAFVTIFAISCIAFADEEDVNDGRTTAATTTTKVTTTATTTAATTTATTTKLNNNSESDTQAVVTATGTTIDAGNVTVGTTKGTTAAVVSNVPYTGSSMAIPAVAVLALLCGTVAVVKTKKD